MTTQLFSAVTAANAVLHAGRFNATCKLATHVAALASLALLAVGTFVVMPGGVLDPVDVTCFVVLAAMYTAYHVYWGYTWACRHRSPPPPVFVAAAALHSTEAIVHAFTSQLAAFNLEARVVLAQDVDPRWVPPALYSPKQPGAPTFTVMSPLLPLGLGDEVARVGSADHSIIAQSSKLCGRLYLLVTQAGAPVGDAYLSPVRAAQFEALTRFDIERPFRFAEEMKATLATGAPSLCAACIPLEMVAENPIASATTNNDDDGVDPTLLCCGATRWRRARTGIASLVTSHERRSRVRWRGGTPLRS